MAASFALRIQSLVAHEAATPTAPVLTVGALHAGTAANIIADEAELLLSLRTFSATSRENMLESVRRIARAEADGAGAVETPDVHAYNGFPATVNTPDATSTVMSDLRQAGLGMHTLSQPLSGSEDFGIFGTAAQCPSVFWHFGGTALQSFDGTALAALAEGRIPPGTPSNHSPRFAPDPAAALPEGVTAMTAAALGALARSA
jgi:hippurate hydrolase